MKKCQTCSDKDEVKLKRFVTGYRVFTVVFVFSVALYIVDDYQNMSGFYMPGLDAFVVKGLYNHTLLIAAHETGHHIWYKRLSEEDRDRWVELHEASNESEFVSEYAKTNHKEDFAESYEKAIYCYYRSDILRDYSPAKADFLDEFFVNDKLTFGSNQWDDIFGGVQIAEE